MSAPGSSGVALRLCAVTRRVGQHTLLRELSLDVAAGQTVVLLGPSGGGKSTLLRCVNALHGFDAGHIEVGPHRLAPGPVERAAGARVRRLVGMVFQDFQLFPHLTALGNVIEAPRRVLGLGRDEAVARGEALLARVGLADRADFWPRQLSGGQKQRVAIARALAMEPRALLCDEITSALDPELKAEVLAVLADLRTEGMTLLVVTHELGFARRVADRIAVLAEGQVVEEGAPAQVLERPATERTQAFLRRVVV